MKINVNLKKNMNNNCVEYITWENIVLECFSFNLNNQYGLL